MMLRPRRYGTLNRTIARCTSHAVNDYYRQKQRAKSNSNYTYNKYDDKNVDRININGDVSDVVPTLLGLFVLIIGVSLLLFLLINAPIVLIILAFILLMNR